MLNENIKAFRKKKGLSQEELAETLHVVRQTVSKWENALSVPDAEMLIRISEVLDCPVSVLLGEHLPEPEQEEKDSLPEIAGKLERLNADWAQVHEKHRRLWHGLSLLAGLLALPGIAQGMLSFLHSQRAMGLLESDPSVIGGADSATSIFVSALSASEALFLLALLLFAAAVIGLYRTRRKS